MYLNNHLHCLYVCVVFSPRRAKKQHTKSASESPNCIRSSTVLFKEPSMLKTLPLDTLAWPRRAAIIGAGTMGLGVAESWLAAGVAVTLVDVAPEQTRLAQARLAQRLQKHAQAGLVDTAVSARVAGMPVADDIASAVAD